MATLKIIRPPVCGDSASDIPTSQWPALIGERRTFCRSVIPRDCRMLLFFLEDGEKAEWLGHENRDAYLRSLDLDPEMVEVALRGLQISDPAKAQPFERMVILGRKSGRPKQDENTYIVRIKRNEHGNSKKSAMLRLERDFPAIHVRVIAGELSANAAAIKAGFRKRPAKKLTVCPYCGHTLP